MGAILYLIMLVVLISWIYNRKNAGAKGGGSRPSASLPGRLFTPKTSSGDILRDVRGLRRPGENPADDISCEEQFGHRHAGRGARQAWDPDRYEAQEELTEGFIILNGKRMRLKDADKY